MTRMCLRSNVQNNKPQRIILLGGGHANIQVLHGLSKIDRSLFSLTLISDVAMSPYSGMLPGYMSGVYSPEDLHFNLVDICKRFNFEFILTSVVKINAHQKNVVLKNDQVITYDICVVNLGIQPITINCDITDEKNIIYLKPISKLIEKWKDICKMSVSEVKDLTIVGGGPAAFEVAVACRQKYSIQSTKIKIITGTGGLLPEQNKQSQFLAREKLENLQIELFENSRVNKIEKDYLLLSDGRRLSRQICFVGTSATAPQFLVHSDLPLSANNFIKVNDYLLVDGLNQIFAAGDCAHLVSQPLPKAGVFAVRQGTVLLNNILDLLNGRAVSGQYKPQKYFLTILLSDRDEAILSYRSLAFKSRISWWLKNYIDLKFMKRFR